MVAALIRFCIKVVFNRNEQSIKELKQEIEHKYQSKDVAREISQGLKDKFKLDDIFRWLERSE